MDAEMARLGPISVPPPPWMGVLGSFAAGVNEEVTLRLFLMTTIAAIAWRILPRMAALWIANAIAALVFGALHFGNVFALGLHLSPFLVAFILLVNGGIGLLCGRLYWTHGIEAAMTAHVACDLVLHGLGPALGATA
jgi:membrane protease YdiL (CAAX protease family)